MRQVINTNLASLDAQRDASTCQGAHASDLKRLPSGLRIERAYDDASGRAIGERVPSPLRSLNDTRRYADNSISLMQTAEGVSGCADGLVAR